MCTDVFISLGLVIFQYPQNWALQHFPVGKWLSFNIMLWYDRRISGSDCTYLLLFYVGVCFLDCMPCATISEVSVRMLLGSLHGGVRLRCSSVAVRFLLGATEGSIMAGTFFQLLCPFLMSESHIPSRRYVSDIHVLYQDRNR